MAKSKGIMLLGLGGKAQGEPGESDEGYDDLGMIAQDVLKSVERDDYEGLKESLKAFVETCLEQREGSEEYNEE